MEPNILIVDDQEDFLEAIMEKLQTMMAESIHINSCSNIYDAEHHINENSPDIVVVDMNLPFTSGEDPEDGSGMQLVLYIRKIPKRTIIILITGETRLEAQDEYLNKGMNEGVDEIILKESRINYVDKLAERVIYLAGLLIKLNSSIGKEMGNTIITYGLHQHIISYFIRHIPKYLYKNITSVQDAIDECEKHNICVCVVAVDNDDGYEFIRRFFNVRQDIPIVAITTRDDIQGFEGLKRARRDGAVFAVRYVKDKNYTEKIIQKALEYRKNKLDSYSNIIGTHPSLLKALGQADVAAKNNEPVLIVGESGTGKELIAMGINKNSGREGSYININCAALPRELLESELFGHAKGAFTGALNTKVGLFEQANGGTIFLDEITELPLDLQAKLLKVIENMTMRRVGGTKFINLDVKVIFATNRNIASMVELGEFRNDFYQRIKAFTVTLPSLLEHTSDIPSIVYYYIDKISNREGKGAIGISDEAMDMLCRCDWSRGNVRELKNMLEKIIAFLPKTREIIMQDDVSEAHVVVSTNIHEPNMLRSLSLKEAENWAGFNHCIAYLKKILQENNTYQVGDKERNKLKQELRINSDGTFYSCIDNGIKIAFKIAKHENGEASLQDILKLISTGSNHGIEKFIENRIKRKPEMATI